jgi:hypothetical protein
MVRSFHHTHRWWSTAILTTTGGRKLLSLGALPLLGALKSQNPSQGGDSHGANPPRSGG